MKDVVTILRDTIDDIKKSGLPKQSVETDAIYCRLVQAALAEIQNLQRKRNAGPSSAILKSLATDLRKLRRKTAIADSIVGRGPKSTLVITEGDHKALSQKMFREAQGLSPGDVQSWRQLCEDAEREHRTNFEGKLPAAYIQTKSNIKRMLMAGMDLRQYKSEARARAVLLKKET